MIDFIVNRTVYWKRYTLAFVNSIDPEHPVHILLIQACKQIVLTCIDTDKTGQAYKMI